MKGDTGRQRRLSEGAHEDPCVLCGGTIGSLVQEVDQIVHALCAMRASAGLPTPCLGHICPVCEGAEKPCGGCDGKRIIGRDQMLPQRQLLGLDERRYDHPEAHPRARLGLHAHSAPCKACGGTVGTLAEGTRGENIHALCKARRMAKMETPCLGHPCRQCQGLSRKGGKPCKGCEGTGKVGMKNTPKPEHKRPPKTVKRA